MYRRLCVIGKDTEEERIELQDNIFSIPCLNFLKNNNNNKKNITERLNNEVVIKQSSICWNNHVSRKTSYSVFLYLLVLGLHQMRRTPSFLNK